MQPYKYNGKELDKMHGLNLYDYSARYYEPAIGRFTTIDLLAEKFYSWSPYVYTFNNPLRFTDPTGMSLKDDIGKFLSKLGHKINKFFGIDQSSDQTGVDRAIQDLSNLEQGAARAEELGKVVEGVADAMTIAHPMGSTLETMAKIVAGQDLTAGNVGGTVLEAGGFGLVGKVGKIAKIIDKAGDAAKPIKSIAEQATDLVKLNGGKNSVTLRTSKQQIRYDLIGKPHNGVETPHKQVYNKNFHNGVQKSITRESKDAYPMTQQELRMIRKYLEKGR